MRSILHSFFFRQLVPALLISSLLMFPLVGCNSNPVDVVSRVVGQLQLIQGYVQDARNLAVIYAQSDPELAKEITEYAQLADVNLANLIQVGNAYVAKPSADTYQSILNGVDAFAASVDQKVLLAAKISNPQTQQKVLLILALASTVAHVVLGLLQQYATKKQLKAVPPIPNRVAWEEVRPYLDRARARESLRQVGLGPQEVEETLTQVGL